MQPINANEADFERFEILGQDGFLQICELQEIRSPRGFTLMICVTVMTAPASRASLKAISWSTTGERLL